MGSSSLRGILLIGIFVVTSNFSHKIWANQEVQRLVDSYLIAKVDNPSLNEDQIKKTPYTIQVASYMNEKDAASHVDELRIQERDVRYIPTFVRDQVWYKVCVGLFDNKEAAETYKRSFMQRVDEPFSTVISMLDRPSKKTTAHLLERTPTRTPRIERSTASTKNTNLLYSLQVGAFPNEKIAEQHVSNLSLKEHSVEIHPAVINGKTWYRVFVGRFETKKEAENFQGLFSQQNKGVSSFIRHVGADQTVTQ